MIIKYKVVEMWPQDHLVVARYWTDIVTEDDLATIRDDNGNILRARTDVSIAVPIPEPSEDELKKIIMRNAPLRFLETLEAVRDANVNTTMANTSQLFNVVEEASDEDILNALAPPVVVSANT
jgi:hypothetical protein